MWFYRNIPGGHRLVDPTTVSWWMRPFIRFQAAFERGFERFRSGYRNLLGMVLSHRMVFSIGFLVFFGGSWMLVPYLGQNFFPNVDAGQFRLHVRAPGGTRIEETTRLVDRVEAVIREVIPAEQLGGILDNVGIPWGGIPLTYLDNGTTGTADADILVSLHPEHDPTDHFVRTLRTRLNAAFPGSTFYFLPADIVNQTINFGLPAPIDIQIMGRDQKKIREIANQIASEIQRVPGAVDIRIQQPANQPELNLTVDRTRASQIGLTERDVATSVLLSLSGSSQTQANYWLNARNGIQYLVNTRVPDYVIDSLDALNTLPLNAPKAGTGSPQLLTNVASIERSTGSPIYTHYNVTPVIDVFVGVSGRDLGGVMAGIRPIIAKAEKQLPKGAFIALRGQADTMKTSFQWLAVGLVLAIVLVYFLLVVNFQSWLYPFVIITALPGALSGVIWGLYLSKTTVSVPALTGAIMSMGVATANSVLVISFARDLLAQGLDPLSAAWNAGVARLRPVLMTALAMIIGMFPMALSLGEGGEQNAPLGRAVIGGLVIATFATLFFVPAVFALFHKKPAESSKPQPGTHVESSGTSPLIEQV
jgi:multidrug efflux pump subunit AcrB